MSACRRTAGWLLAASALIGVGCGSTADIDPMKLQGKYKAYRQSDFFDDGMAMRHPVAGTVPRERILAPASFNTGIDGEGKFLTQIPVPVTKELVAQGRKGYDTYCATCHGFLGDSNSVVARKFSQIKPPKLVDLRPVAGRVFAAATDGYGVMPSYAAQLSTPERWAVAAYVQALVLSQRAEIDKLPAALQRKIREMPQP
jgi:mono/diheme cytochrome c family protein